MTRPVSAKRDLAEGGGERERRKPLASSREPDSRDWGAAVIFLATGILVAAVAFGSCVAKIEAPGGTKAAAAPLSQPPTSSEVGPAGLEIEPGASRAARTETRRGAEPQSLCAEWRRGEGSKGTYPGAKRSRCNFGPCPPGLVVEMGGCGESRWQGEPTPAIGGNGYCRMASGPVRTRPLESGQPPISFSVRRALDLLRMHESVNGTRMVGDSGRAQGWLQQHEANWREGCERLGVRWPWPADTRDLAKCEAVCLANWARYCPDALERGDVELLVRSHRLPCAPWRADNDAYWRKVKDRG